MTLIIFDDAQGRTKPFHPHQENMFKTVQIQELTSLLKVPWKT